MKIAVIGMGSVGATLGQRWAELGHAVTFGAKDPGDAKAKALIGRIGNGAAVRTVAKAAADAEVVVLATPASANADAIAAAGDLSGKILIDVTNPLKPDLSGLTVGPDSSGAEQWRSSRPRPASTRRSTRRVSRTWRTLSSRPVVPSCSWQAMTPPANPWCSSS